jgi:sterol desaturase/sphingolipid hydroxylase (fatty acid hydroxylase superfamily)
MSEGANYRLLITAIFVVFGVAEVVAGRFLNKETRRRDLVIEVLSSVTILVFTVPAILWIVDVAAEAAAPQWRDVWAHWPWWAMLAVLLVADDMTQYWWHRANHAVPWLFHLHRAHHSANYMSVRMTFRNNVFYYWLMPGLWLSALLIFCGFGGVYAIYAVVKMAVIVGAHSSVRWDAPLYRHRATGKLMWIVERVISTPATHNAHHGLRADDPATYYAGNYGNLLFFWDVLFGTAKITRAYPADFGVENEEPRSWQSELFWPLFRG